jgi:alcohol dehydrogenase class IV
MSVPLTVFGTGSLVEAVRRLSMRRVAVVTTNSLSGPGGLAEAVVKVLGSKFQSIVSGIHPHTPREDVIRVAKALDGIDGVVTIGGGSVCDSVKAARRCRPLCPPANSRLQPA